MKLNSKRGTNVHIMNTQATPSKTELKPEHEVFVQRLAGMLEQPRALFHFNVLYNRIEALLASANEVREQDKNKLLAMQVAESEVFTRRRVRDALDII